MHESYCLFITFTVPQYAWRMLICALFTPFHTIADNTAIEAIITTNPKATTNKNSTLIQLSTATVVPVPTSTDPYRRASAVAPAAATAMCCHAIAMKVPNDAAVEHNSAKKDMARLGNGLTSLALPFESSSSCQPGKVPRIEIVAIFRSKHNMLG